MPYHRPVVLMYGNHWSMMCHTWVPLVDDVPYISTTGRWYVIHYYHWSMMCHTLLPLVDDVPYIITTGRWYAISSTSGTSVWRIINQWYSCMAHHQPVVIMHDISSTSGTNVWHIIDQWYYHWSMICHTLVPLVDDMSYIITTGRWCAIH
jgi:hypothetical protein